jgi:hypothetical protein
MASGITFNFASFADSTLSSAAALRELKKYDSDFATADGRVFSNDVLGEYYTLCREARAVLATEGSDGRWAENHLDRRPDLRVAAAANVLAKRHFDQRIEDGALKRENGLLKGRVALLETDILSIRRELESARFARPVVTLIQPSAALPPGAPATHVAMGSAVRGTHGSVPGAHVAVGSAARGAHGSVPGVRYY